MNSESQQSNALDINSEAVYPAYGIEVPSYLDTDAFKSLGRQVRDLTSEEALLHGNEILAAGNVVRIDAAALGHTPDGRGRETGPSNRYWRDYCNTTAGKICFGPYHDLDPGVYVFYYDLTFQIPVCGGSNNTVVFSMDTTEIRGGVPGLTIPGSSVWVLRWDFMCANADENNVFQGSWGGRFASARRIEGAEMRLGNSLTQLAGIPIEILVRSLTYWKE